VAAPPTESPAPDQSAQRIFLAAWPDATLRTQLRDLADALEHHRVGGRRVAERNYHLTVAFLGALHAAQVDALIELIRDLEFPQVELVFDRFGFWPRPRIVWLGCRVVPEALKAFEGRLRRSLVQLGLVTERRAFSPHITLFRKATRRSRLELTPLRWSVDGLCVVRSVHGPAGARYQVLQTTPSTSNLHVDGQYM
jgi:2'-5' RNA ligase